MSLPNLHSPTTFAAILDPEKGGRFTLAPAGRFEASRRYLGRTNVLETTYRTGGGVVRVTEALTLQDGGLLPWVEHARRIEGLEGTVRLEWRVEPRFDWGREPPRITLRNDVLVAEGADVQLAVHSWDAGEVEAEEDALAGSFEIGAGERALLALVASHEQPLHSPGRDHVEARLDAAPKVWERWLGMWAYDGPWEDEVARSALALKLLVYAPNGSIAAAPTTSLPEVVGGDKNYDYRYAWVRDSAFTLDALMRLGLPEQVQESFSFLLRAVRQTAPDLRPFYDLDGEIPTRCDELDLRGYRDSRPVHYGNAASDQLQLGSWGDLLETADLYVSDGNLLDEDTGRVLADCVDRVTTLWGDEDSGMWELRELRHYTGSKITVWTALDRAIRLADEGQLPAAHLSRWQEGRKRVRAWIEENAWSEELGAYRGWAGEEKLDAAVLRAVRQEYPEKERLGRTVDAIRERLAAAPGLIYRSSEHAEEREGAFVACSFWVAEALARLGRVDEACETMEQILPYANDLGLFSEQIDPSSGEHLGNFPQGLSHLALINAAGAIQDAAGRAAGTSAKARAARG